MNADTTTVKIPSPAPGAGRPALRAVFLRSFFIQAGWNYERFQNLGFAFALQPALALICPDKGKLKAALLRHLQIFNTQPYMAAFVLGNIVRIEESAAAAPDPEATLKNMPGVKQALASSFASIGDRVFWGRLKPMTTQLCLLVWAIGGFYGWLFTGYNDRPSLLLLLAGPLSGIAVYSVFSVYWRWKGLLSGYACGGSSACGLDSANWGGIIRWLSTAGFAMSVTVVLLALGLLVGLSGGLSSGGDLLRGLWLPLAVLALHRGARALGRSVFFSAGLILAVSVLYFGFFNRSY